MNCSLGDLLQCYIAMRRTSVFPSNILIIVLDTSIIRLKYRFIKSRQTQFINTDNDMSHVSQWFKHATKMMINVKISSISSLGELGLCWHGKGLKCYWQVYHIWETTFCWYMLNQIANFTFFFISGTNTSQEFKLIT